MRTVTLPLRTRIYLQGVAVRKRLFMMSWNVFGLINKLYKITIKFGKTLINRSHVASYIFHVIFMTNLSQ